MLNSRDISLLRPDVAANCRAWLQRCRAAGLSVLVTSTVRDIEYQAWLYEQGRSRPGSIVTNGRRPTFHWDKAGLAFDFCKNVKGHEYDDAAFFRRAAAIAKEMGFTWGGDWTSFRDMPHIQWDYHGKYTNSDILAGRMPPTMALYQEGDEEMTYYKTINDVPAAYKPSVQKAMSLGALRGTGAGTINVSEDLCRTLTVLDRLGSMEKGD